VHCAPKTHRPARSATGQADLSAPYWKYGVPFPPPAKCAGSSCPGLLAPSPDIAQRQGGPLSIWSRAPSLSCQKKMPQTMAIYASAREHHLGRSGASRCYENSSILFGRPQWSHAGILVNHGRCRDPRTLVLLENVTEPSPETVDVAKPPRIQGTADGRGFKPPHLEHRHAVAELKDRERRAALAAKMSGPKPSLRGSARIWPAPAGGSSSAGPYFSSSLPKAGGLNPFRPPAEGG